MSISQSDIVRGVGSKASPLTSALLQADSRELPTALRATGNTQPAPIGVPLSRYFDPEFATLEYQHLWNKTWQFACREEDIPEVGDRYRYDVGPQSWFLVRSAADEIRAFYNTCLHRGTRLCNSNGHDRSIRCPFHGWQWDLDGSLKHIPSRWDFPRVKDKNYGLPQAQVATWDGFVFINPDPNATPLQAALGVLPEHFSEWQTEPRYTLFHMRKLVRANWKITLEAFLESYHVIQTHTEVMPFTGDASTQYDVWDDGESHISRLLTPTAIPSPHLGDDASAEEAANQAFEAFALAMPGLPVPKCDRDSDVEPRAQVAQWRRQMMQEHLGLDYSQASDATMIDNIQYFMFPNFCPWYGEGLPLVYQFLPYGNDPNQSVMSVRVTAPLPVDDAPRPASAPIMELGFDDRFDTLPEIGLLAQIFDQDMGNLPNIQAGLAAARPDRAFTTLGAYQEQRISHFHAVLADIVGSE